jgi:hypothetical protein
LDPNLFHLDWERTGEVLAAIVVLSFFVERALALLFENRHFIARFDGKGVKEPIAFLACVLVCWQWDFDAVSMVILAEKTSLIGQLITAGVIAGGSEASIKLVHDVLKVKSGKQAEVDAQAEAETHAKAAAAAARAVKGLA